MNVHAFIDQLLKYQQVFCSVNKDVPVCRSLILRVHIPGWWILQVNIWNFPLQVSREVGGREKELTHQVHREILVRCLEQVKTLAPILICSMKIFIHIIAQGLKWLITQLMYYTLYFFSLLWVWDITVSGGTLKLMINTIFNKMYYATVEVITVKSCFSCCSFTKYVPFTVSTKISVQWNWKYPHILDFIIY
jgi:hypothetical protein